MSVRFAGALLLLGTAACALLWGFFALQAAHKLLPGEGIGPYAGDDATYYTLAVPLLLPWGLLFVCVFTRSKQSGRTQGCGWLDVSCVGATDGGAHVLCCLSSLQPNVAHVAAATHALSTPVAIANPSFWSPCRYANWLSFSFFRYNL